MSPSQVIALDALTCVIQLKIVKERKKELKKLAILSQPTIQKVQLNQIFEESQSYSYYRGGKVTIDNKYDALMGEDADKEEELGANAILEVAPKIIHVEKPKEKPTNILDYTSLRPISLLHGSVHPFNLKDTIVDA
ncbi:hypothetical protein LIER_38987 [Lithospermum erythrorhizon]|uniref:Uncharacterized protein n=1 Tax=Lithospermum erythrorhizon TaxID=34254 RepID=A0AAV3Q7Y0_LITER